MAGGSTAVPVGFMRHSAETKCDWELRGWDEQGQCRDSNRGRRIHSETRGNKGNKGGEES